ncbi:hypothetical protein A5678_04530 [Mycobacterium sp. E2733]|nr:hypothetical protein A5678_04530 [Mycobacterium sp. E2733]
MEIVAGRVKSFAAAWRGDSTLRTVQDAELRHGTVELFEIARQMAKTGEVDVVVLAARRLACIYQLLVEHGMEPLSGCAVISDRYLDVPGDWPWRRVLVLDDSVILGTTLLRIYDDIKKRIGPKGFISCRAVCVDEDQRADYLLDAVNLKAMHSRPSDAVEAYSKQIVEALFAGGVPFFSDFPMTKKIALTSVEWEDHLFNDGWHVADVTPPLFDKDSRKAFSHIPADATIDHILCRIPVEVAALVESLKVRSYLLARNPSGVTVKFVAIAMLAPCTPDELDTALTALSSLPEVKKSLDNAEPLWGEWSPEAKHRLVQMYVATCLLDEALAFARGSAEAKQWQFDRLQSELYFGPGSSLMLRLTDIALKNFRSRTTYEKGRPPQDNLNRPRPSWLLEDEALLETLWESRELIAYTGTPEEPRPDEISRVGLIFGHAIASIFGYIHRRFEIPQRKEIQALGSLAKYRKAFPRNNGRRVLSQGITLRDLIDSLLPESVAGSSWSRALVSLGIDIGNDLGIIVPVTQYDHIRDVVYRAYRLGETAPLAMNPLPQAAADGDWDEYARTAELGFPLLNQEVQRAADIASSEMDGWSSGWFGLPVPEAATRWLGLAVEQLLPQLQHIHLALGDARLNKRPELLDDLRRKVLEAVPGRVVLQLDGEVTKIEDDEFTAQFIEPLNESIRMATIPVSQLSTNDQKALTDGSLVMWSVIQDNDSDKPQRISRVRVRHEAPIDLDQLKRNAELF